MALENLDKTLPRKGGLARVRLLAADSFLGADHDGRGNYSGLRLAAGAQFAELELREGGAMYEETVEYDNGDTIVTHRITLDVSASAADTDRIIRQLAEASEPGIVALIQATGGQWKLAGYSEKFGTECALRLATAESSSGRRPAEPASDNIVLKSRDTQKAGNLIQ